MGLAFFIFLRNGTGRQEQTFFIKGNRGGERENGK